MPNKKYIIIADDNEFFWKILQGELTQRGYDVVPVANGQEVIDKSRESKPDLVLLDIIMPVKDGFETIAEIKKDPHLKDIKIVIFSNLGQKEDIEKAKEMGASGYIVKKDFSIKDLIDKVENFLSK